MPLSIVVSNLVRFAVQLLLLLLVFLFYIFFFRKLPASIQLVYFTISGCCLL